jgi:transposase-like protein
MKKMLWFTKSQNDVLNELKPIVKMNNSEIVRQALKEFAIKYGVNIPEDYNALDARG